MSVQETLAIIKPDAVAANNVGNIVAKIQSKGLKIVAMKMLHLNEKLAQGFYAVHRERPFFNDLVAFMTEGPVVVMILQAENAIARWRELMGATNPANADEGTIRKEFATNIERNAVHGSDAEETAAFETRYFFNAVELS